MLNLVHARTFLAVLSERGFRAAARDLKLSPSTVVEHIKQLEEDLAAPLLVRRRGIVEPTSQGAAFAPLARAMLDTAARSRTMLAQARLRIASSSNVGTYLLQSMLASFQATDPCSVDLWIGPNPDVAERLTNGTADVALMEWWSDRPGFCGYTWRKEPLVVIVAPDHPWAKRHAIEASELASQTFWEAKREREPITLLRKTLGTFGGRFDRYRRLWKYGSGQAGRPRRPGRFACDSGGGRRRSRGGTARRPAPERNRTCEGIEDHFADRFARYGACRALRRPRSERCLLVPKR